MAVIQSSKKSFRRIILKRPQRSEIRSLRSFWYVVVYNIGSSTFSYRNISKKYYDIRSEFFRIIFGTSAVSTGNMDSIDLDVTFHWDYNAFASVNDLCLNQHRTVRVDMDHNIRCLDLCTPRVGDIVCHERGVFACNCLISLIKCFEFFVLYAALFKETFYLRFGQDSRLRRIFL